MDGQGKRRLGHAVAGHEAARFEAAHREPRFRPAAALGHARTQRQGLRCSQCLAAAMRFEGSRTVELLDRDAVPKQLTVNPAKTMPDGR